MPARGINSGLSAEAAAFIFADPKRYQKALDEFVTRRTEAESAEAALNSARAQLDKDAEALASREAAVSAREADVTVRERAAAEQLETSENMTLQARALMAEARAEKAQVEERAQVIDTRISDALGALKALMREDLDAAIAALKQA